MGVLFDIANTFLGTFSGPMLGIFWLAMFSKRTNSFSVIVGGIVGMVVLGCVILLRSLYGKWYILDEALGGRVLSEAAVRLHPWLPGS